MSHKLTASGACLKNNSVLRSTAVAKADSGRQLRKRPVSKPKRFYEIAGSIGGEIDTEKKVSKSAAKKKRMEAAKKGGSTSTSFNNLPDMIQQQIISYQPLEKRCALERLSHHWQTSSRCSPLYRINCFHYLLWSDQYGRDSMSSSVVEWLRSVLSRYGKSVITLLIPYSITAQLADLVSNCCPGLRSLTATGVDLNSIELFKKLSSLSVARLQTSMSMGTLTTASATYLAGLRELRLFYVDRMELERLRDLAGGSLPSIRRFGTDEQFLPTGDVFPNLETLTLRRKTAEIPVSLKWKIPPRIKYIGMNVFGERVPNVNDDDLLLQLCQGVRYNMEGIYINGWPDQFKKFGFLELSGNLTNLKVTNQKAFTTAELSHLSEDARLTSLCIDRCPAACDATIKWLIGRRFALTELRMAKREWGGTSWPGITMPELEELLKACPMLKVLDVAGHMSVNGTIFDLICEYSRNLRLLAVYHTSCWRPDLKRFIQLRIDLIKDSCPWLPFIFVRLRETVGAVFVRARVHELSVRWMMLRDWYRDFDVFDTNG